MSAEGSSTTSRKRGSKEMEDEDNLVIVNAFLDFKSQHGGSHPTPTTIAPLLDAIKGSLHHQLTSDQLYNKFRSLKNKYYRAANAGGPGPTPLDRAFYDVAVKVWGKKSANVEEKMPEVDVVENGNGVLDGDDEKKDEDEDEEEEEEEEEEVDEEVEGNDDDVDNLDEKYASICDTYKYLTRALREQWERNGDSMTTLKAALMNMNKEKAEKLDQKWKNHFIEGIEIKAMELKVHQKILEAVAAGYKDED